VATESRQQLGARGNSSGKMTPCLHASRKFLASIPRFTRVTYIPSQFWAGSRPFADSTSGDCAILVSNGRASASAEQSEWAHRYARRI